MLEIWIGRARTGKSQRVLERIKALGTSGQQILLVPEHASHQAEVDLCAVCGDGASSHAEVLSFRQLGTRVLSRTGGAAEVSLDKGGKLLTLEKVLQELAPVLKVYRRPSQKIGFLEGLMSLTDELMSYAVAPETLAEQAADIPGAMGDKLRDLSLIYGAYDARLHGEGRDLRDRMHKLNEHLEESGYLDGKDIFIDGFTYFNGQEARAVSAMLRRAKSVTVTLLGERERRSEIFDESLRTREELLRLAREAGVEAEVVWFSREMEGPLGHLERNFFGGNEPWKEAAGEIRLLEASTSFTEAEQAAAEILRLVSSGSYRFRDITVAARNLEEYEASIENVFERYGVPVFLSRRSDILEKPVLSLLVGVLEAVTGGFEYEDMFRFLKTGLAGLDPDQCDTLENYVLKWDIRGSMWLREGDWTANPDGYGAPFEEAQEAALEEINSLRRLVRTPLKQLAEELKERKNASGKVKALYRYLEEIRLQDSLQSRLEQLQKEGGLQLAEEYGQLWEILCGVLDQFVEILGDTELDGEEFSRLLRLVLTQYSVGTIPVALDQVTVSEITRNDRHTVKCLFLLGANDHVLPAVDPGGGLLSEDDREALSVRGIRLAPTGMRQFHVELQNLYAALAQPTERLYVSYPVTDVSGAELRPSFVVGRLRSLFPAVRLEHERSEKEYRFTAMTPALEAAGESPGGVLWRYFAEKPEFRERLAAMERGRHMGRGRLSPEVVTELYGQRVAMSASRMDTLGRCHFSYFMRYGLRAQAREPAAFDAPEIGTFLHYILEHVTREVMEQGGFTQVGRKELHRLAGKYIDAYVEKELQNFKDRSARFRYLFNRLKRTVLAVLDNVAAELAESDFVPLAFELSFGPNGQLPAVTISEGDTELRLSGKVDRVDGWLHDGKLYLRVVDYKTGKKAFDLSEIRMGIGIQMLLYLFTLQKEGTAYFGQAVEPAGVLYLPARDALLRMEPTASPEAVEAALGKELRRSGMVLEAPEVLRAMEHSALEEPRYLPLNVGRNGDVHGAIASAAQLGQLGKYVERQLRQIAREMRQGDIDADPCWHSEDDNACRYCDFAAACHFQEGRDGDRVRWLRSLKPEEFWQEVAMETREGGERHD